jgi:hypothetical protein
MVLWELLTGCRQVPFGGIPLHVLDEGTHHKQGSLPDIPDELAQQHPRLVQLMQGCWAATANNR